MNQESARLKSAMSPLALAVVALSLTVAAACPAPPESTAFITASVAGDGTVLSDGTATITVQAQAQNADGEADESQLSASATEGGFLAADGTFVETIVVPMGGGGGSVSYQCVRLSNEVVTVTLNNGAATTTATVNCVSPPVVVALDVGSCDPQAIEGRTCAVTIDASLTTGGDPEPLDGEVLTITVESLANIEDIDDPDSEGDFKVLLVEPGTVLPQSTIEVTTDDNGIATHYIRAPKDGLLQEMTLSVATRDLDPATNRQTYVSTIIAPAAEYSLNIPPVVNVSAETDAPVAIVLTGPATNVEAMEMVSATIATATPNLFAAALTFVENGGAEYDATLDRVTDTLDFSGLVTVALPALAPNIDDAVATLTVEYAPADGSPPIVRTSVINIVRPGVLLLNASLAAGTVFADKVAEGLNRTLLTVTVTRDGTGVNEPVTITIDPSATDRADIVTPNEIEDIVTVTPTNGLVSVTVQAEDEDARGLVPINVSVLDDSVTPAVLREVEVELLVDRTPVLQSVVFVSAAPEFLGVQGSALPGSSVLTFQAFYDDGNPAPNASVEYALPGSVDPTATVAPTGVTGAGGLTTTVLSSGTQAGPLTVTAAVSLNGKTVTVESFPVPVVGGLPNFAQSYLVCDTANVIHVPPVNIDCQAVMADRFSNQIQQTLSVQFRAEGGNITPFAPLQGSGATGSFASGAPGRASADIYGWSYGAALPEFDDDIVTSAYFDANNRQGCTDRSAASACDLYSLCNEGANEAYCPLPVAEDGTGCWESLPKAALAILGTETAECTRTVVAGTGDPANPGDLQVACTDGTNITVSRGEFGTVTGAQYATDPELKTLIDAFRDTGLDCGFPSACLVGRADGFSVISGDECNAALGCYDFNGVSNCPQDGLHTIMASVRGEEAFVDANGNGIFDYDDANGNGRHDTNEIADETWVDMPEPFLDKTDNCNLDDYNGHPRLLPIEEVIQSDIYSDVDNSQDFGFDDGTPVRKFVNGRFDRDTEIYVEGRLLALAGETPILSMGESCTAAEALPGASHTCTAGNLASCNMLTDTFGVAECDIPNLVFGDLANASFVHAWHDARGNCHSVGHASTTTVTVTGAIKLFGETLADIEGCGISETGNAVLNPYRPYCGAAPTLGPQMGPNGAISGAFQNSIALDCENGNGAEPASVTFVHSDGRTVEFGFTTVCPEDE